MGFEKSPLVMDLRNYVGSVETCQSGKESRFAMWNRRRERGYTIQCIQELNLALRYMETDVLIYTAGYRCLIGSDPLIPILFPVSC